MFYNPFYFVPKIPNINNNPPTLYSILNSIANYGKKEQTQIEDLASVTHSDVFTFNYPLSEKVNKDDFETLILNRFLMRRIGFETFTAFKINLNVKMNIIMPKYNILFDSLIDWNILNDKEITERIGNDNIQTNGENNSTTSNNVDNNSNTTLSNTSRTENETEKRFSELPQNQISEITDGNYMTQYTLDNSTSIDNSTQEGFTNSNTLTINENQSTNNNIEDKNYSEKIERTISPAEKFTIYSEIQKNLENIYEMILNELNDLFYSIIN